jgi:iron complex outermembrane recepter protein
MNSNQISKAVRYALVAGAASAISAPAVFAQQAPAASTSATPATAQLGKIEVTGSRIKRTSVETAQPITIVTAAQIKASGYTSLGDVLQTLTQAGSTENALVNNGNDGQAFVQLRNLSANRTLVLVNGKRWVTDIANLVDMNSIPTSVIDHIEVLQDGASAIYGSDAITGVINIVTVKNYNGAEADAYMGIYHGDGHTDGKTQQYDYTIGSGNDRSNVVMNVSYTNQNPILAGERNISKEAIYGVGGGSSSTPGGRFYLYNAGNVCGPLGGGTSCDLTLINPPVAGKPTPVSDWRTFNFATDAYNYAPVNYLLIPQEKTSLYVQGHYDLADNLTFTSTVLFNNSQSKEQLAAEPLFLGQANNGETNAGANIGVAAGNPYNPWGVDLVPYAPSDPQFASWCAAYGSANCDTTGVSALLIRRRYTEGLPRIQTENFDTYFWNGGFNGYFNMLGGEWDWDAGASFGRVYHNQVLQGNFNTSRLQEALSENCGTTLDPSCVPLNIFGGASRTNPTMGTLTPAQQTYISFTGHNIDYDNQRDYTANITNSNLFNLPAGPVGLAMGYEYYETDGAFQPDALVSLGETTGNAALPTSGRVATNSQYIEFNIPLVADVPFMKNVSLDIANRWSQFKWGGLGAGSAYVPGADHASAGRWALRWQATNDLLLRASWAQGFRVPSISEFYAGVGNNFPPATDPCQATAPVQGPYCAANGHPIGPGQSGGQINTLAGGNANMTPEKSISKTVGFVYNPDWFPGFDFSADYYHIEVDNLIGTIGTQNLINGCYFGNVQSYCSKIQVVGKQINLVSDTNTNIGSVITDGYDFSTHYKFPSSSIGDFKLGLDFTFLKDFNATYSTGTGFGVDRLAGWYSPSPLSNGSLPYPKEKATLTLGWNYGDWSAMWSMYYVDHMIEACTNGQASPTTLLAACTYNYNTANAAIYQYYFGVPLPNNGAARQWGPNGQTQYFAQNYIGATVYNNVQGTYHVDSWNTDFTLGIQNVFDKKPASSISAFANSFDPFTNPVPGQFFYGRVSVKF